MIPSGVRIFVCSAPVDLRLGFDRLAHAARERVGTDPMSGGALFVFTNKRATRLKVLWFERNGFCLLYKRLHQAVFELPAASAGSSEQPETQQKLAANVFRRAVLSLPS